MKCRHCETELTFPFVDLGSAPPSNSYLTEEGMRDTEKWYPLRVLVCTHCWLVQTEDFADREEFFNADYAYFSSFSTTWLEHAKQYIAEMVTRFNLNTNSHVIEVAANDGYLLQYVKALNIPCTGVEPTASTAKLAREKGITIVEDFFSISLAKELIAQGKQADLITANNVLAHVPDINDFVAAFAILLKPKGVATFEFPYLMDLIEGTQFDTIYHEHFSYFSVTAVNHIFTSNGLSIFDIEQLKTHGGSLRVYAQRIDQGVMPTSSYVIDLLNKENHKGITLPSCYTDFHYKVDKVKNAFLSFLIDARNQDKSVAAYGAAAKGNTIMNYAGIRPDLISFVVDRNPAKQGKFMPGSRIPIVDEKHLLTHKPDYVVILPWNLKAEVIQQHLYIKDWGGHFVTVVPCLEVI